MEFNNRSVQRDELARSGSLGMLDASGYDPSLSGSGRQEAGEANECFETGNGSLKVNKFKQDITSGLHSPTSDAFHSRTPKRRDVAGDEPN